MCGIFGVVTNSHSSISDRNLSILLKELFSLSEKRGMEASGLVLKNHSNNRISTLRQDVNGRKFVISSAYQSILKSNLGKNRSNGLTIFGHTRIATNGNLILDNQPIEKDGCFGVHNGIICNLESLWSENQSLDRRQMIDTELLLGLLKKKLDDNSGHDIHGGLKQLFFEIEGTASFGALFNNYNSVIIASNCGSLYVVVGEGYIVFSSEEDILKRSLEKSKLKFQKDSVYQLKPTSFGIVDEERLSFEQFNIETEQMVNMVSVTKEFKHVECSSSSFLHPLNSNTETLKKHDVDFVYNPEMMMTLKRCSNCILPFTHPYIDFDESGVCNYCRNYSIRKKKNLWGKEKFEKDFIELKKRKGINCIVMLSGGRDSCYALHLVKKELGLNPIAFSYDWGMLTDLGRRNQVRMCAKLGVEHIIVSADIKYKRVNIRKNVQAFLHKPNLGVIGLFMAGDKAVNHHAAELSKKLDLPLIGGSCPIEWTYFKEGFSNVKPNFQKRTWSDRFAMINFFVTEAFRNPKLLNSSLLDTFKAYKYYYLESLNVTNVFRYLPWEEGEVNRVLVELYNWEKSPDTITTWRIGDGTAAFYNYIYCTVAGFTENDCLRSNQILEGLMNREEALEKAIAENKPRIDSIIWYCNTIGLDVNETISKINGIPKMFK